MIKARAHKGGVRIGNNLILKALSPNTTNGELES
jgi:hypothetical protein